MAHTVLDFYEKFKSVKAPNTLEIANCLKAWLQNHIMGTDKLYRAFLNEKGVR